MTASDCCVNWQLADHQNRFNQLLGNSTDLIMKPLQLDDHTALLLVYIDGMINTEVLHNAILYSLLSRTTVEQLQHLKGEQMLTRLHERLLIASDASLVADREEHIQLLMSGDILLVTAGTDMALRIGLPGWEDRNVSEPSSQTVVRGPMEGFTENIRTNTALIRRKIKDKHLRLETLHIGRVTHTCVSMMYLSNIANEEVVAEAKRRLQAIDIDSILESGYIEELIQDHTATPFPTIYNSDRPDTIAAGILEGRVAILVDGTPFVLLVPAFYISFFQSPEDYYNRADISTLMRFVRFTSFFITMLAPSFYVALTTYHQEMVPTNLVISLAAQRETIPFPAFVEAMLMEITYEILREAGVRIPKNIGQAISIVGTLVIGQAAVAAGFISSAMVIIVSITAISSFVIPEPGLAIAARIIRFVLILLAGFMGIYGLIFGGMMLIIHMASLRSFGMPYMNDLGPYYSRDLKDSIFRLPWKLMKTRPISYHSTDVTRQRTTKEKERQTDE